MITYRILVLTINCSIIFFNAYGFVNNDTSKTSYINAFEIISQLLERNNPSFKNAVFVTENAYFNNSLSNVEFESEIQYLVFWARQKEKSISLNSYKYGDSIFVKRNMAIYEVMKDTSKIYLKGGEIRYHFPFTYDFTDFNGKINWSKMFVTKLLKTNSGNCHSLPYLYKILADELGVSNVWLSFAPYHMYIKNHSEGIGWYNTELTSGQFPVDPWIMASGYVSPDAIRSGIYMDTISNREAIANCALDLAKGYERKFHIYTDSFLIRCCALTLKYFPNNINAIVYKAEILNKLYHINKKDQPELASSFYPEMEKLYLRAMDLGYKEMPEKMYRQWLESVIKQKDKYKNEKAPSVVKKKV